eukprot:2354755-Prorocentrum_lima.AAC.1
MTVCVYAHARLRQCPCLRASAFTHVLINNRVNVCLCSSASVAMPWLRPRPNERTAKTCVLRRQNRHGRRRSPYKGT